MTMIRATISTNFSVTDLHVYVHPEIFRFVWRASERLFDRCRDPGHDWSYFRRLPGGHAGNILRSNPVVNPNQQANAM